MILAAALALSGCWPKIVEQARDESIRNVAQATSDAVECFAEVRIAKGEDLEALARSNGLCGNWTALGATDEEILGWKWDDINTAWLIQIDESTDTPIIEVLAIGEGHASSWTQSETHRVIVCWQVALDPSGGKPHVTELECPEPWLTSWGKAEVMTLEELVTAADELGVALQT